MKQIRVSIPLLLLASALAIFLCLFLLYPISHSLLQAFHYKGEFSLELLQLVATSPSYWRVILKSINIALTVSFGTVLLAVPLALLFASYKFSFKPILSLLLVVPLILPPFVGVLGFRALMSRFGTVNLSLQTLGLSDAPIDFLGTYPAFGVILVQILHLFPLVYLAVAATLSSLDYALIEASRSLGASSLTTFRRVVAPLLMQSALSSAALVFIASLTDVGTPLLFEQREVLAVQIFERVSDSHENPLGYVLVVFVAILSVSLFASAHLFRSSSNFQSTGRSLIPFRVTALSGLQGVMCSTIVSLVVIIALLPHVGVVLLSLSQVWFMSAFPEDWTMQHFAEVLQHPLTSRSLVNSLSLSAASALLVAIVSISSAYLALRTRFSVGKLFDALTMLPLAIPGIVFAFGYVGCFYGTFLDNRINPIPLLIVAYAVRRLPFMQRAAHGGFEAASLVLEDAARSVGASSVRAFFKISLPLMKGHLLAGVLVCFVFSMLEVSDSLVLALEERYYPVSKAIYALSLRPEGVELAAALGVVMMIATVLLLACASRISAKGLGDLLRF